MGISSSKPSTIGQDPFSALSEELIVKIAGHLAPSDITFELVTYPDDDPQNTVLGEFGVAKLPNKKNPSEAKDLVNFSATCKRHYRIADEVLRKEVQWRLILPHYSLALSGEKPRTPSSTRLSNIIAFARTLEVRGTDAQRWWCCPQGCLQCNIVCRWTLSMKQTEGAGMGPSQLHGILIRFDPQWATHGLEFWRDVHTSLSRTWHSLARSENAGMGRFAPDRLALLCVRVRPGLYHPSSATEDVGGYVTLPPSVAAVMAVRARRRMGEEIWRDIHRIMAGEIAKRKEASKKGKRAKLIIDHDRLTTV